MKRILAKLEVRLIKNECCREQIIYHAKIHLDKLQNAHCDGVQLHTANNSVSFRELAVSIILWFSQMFRSQLVIHKKVHKNGMFWTHPLWANCLMAFVMWQHGLGHRLTFPFFSL
jgi:hypothetical protein